MDQEDVSPTLVKGGGVDRLELETREAHAAAEECDQGSRASVFGITTMASDNPPGLTHGSPAAEIRDYLGLTNSSEDRDSWKDFNVSVCDHLDLFT